MSTVALASTVAVVITAVTTGVPGLDLARLQSETLWLLVSGFIIAFILAFAVGANDVANSFGTTVGAKTLTLKQACILASVFETLGAILLGAKVGETIRKGIIDAEIYRGSEKLLMVGEVSAMIGSGLWQLVATFLRLPVSGTHSIVGATVGFSLVAMGMQGVNWVKLGMIFASWFISPVLAGGLAALFYFMLRKLIFLKNDPVTPGLLALPILYGCTIAVNFFSVFYSGAPLLGLNELPVWADVVIALLLGMISYTIVRLVVVAKMQASIDKDNQRMLQAALIPQHGMNSSSNIQPVKKTIHPPTLETISEKEPLMEEESNNANGNGMTGAGDASNTKSALNSSPRKQRSLRCNSEVDPPSYNETNAYRSQGQKARRVLMQQDTKQRSQSASDHHGSTVRIPPVLQLEKNVLKAQIREPTFLELKEAIRKNFSEPSMIRLAEKVEGNFFEVHIDRQRRAIKIQRMRHRTLSGGDGANSVKSYSNSVDNPEQKQLTEGDSTDHLADGLPKGTQTELEEPFDDSEDEGMGLTMNAANCDHQDMIVVASEKRSYPGAIEEGFRKLSSSQQHDIIEVQVAGPAVKDLEVEKAKKKGEEEDKEDRFAVRKIFSFLQILTACFGSFAHGGNDVSNAIGPAIALYMIYNEGVQQESFTPLWILFYGGIGICVGLWVWGRRVIKTMGDDLTSLTPSRGFAIELMSAVTVLAASNVGIPVSTTHCKVGAVVAVGWVRSRKAVDWKIFRNIVLAWFVTVPVSGGLSAVVFAIMRAAAGL